MTVCVSSLDVGLSAQDGLNEAGGLFEESAHPVIWARGNFDLLSGPERALNFAQATSGGKSGPSAGAEEASELTTSACCARVMGSTLWQLLGWCRNVVPKLIRLPSTHFVPHIYPRSTEGNGCTQVRLDPRAYDF